MTRARRKLLSAGILPEHITEDSARHVEILVTDEDGDTDHDGTEDAARTAAKALKWGGYRTGYGAWVLQKDYASPGDFMDKASRWHY